MEPHPHDKQWIREQLGRLRPTDRATAAKEYQKLFSVILARDEGSTKAYGNARRAANTFLRDFVDDLS